MKLTRFACVVSIASMLLAGNAFGASVFSDDFNAENGGAGVVNYVAFANWTVTSGSVDLIGNGYYDFLPGNGLYIDMDGSTSQAGTIESIAIPLAAGTYQLSFDLAGNRRIDTRDQVTAQVNVGPLFAEDFSLPFDAGFTHYVRNFSVASPTTVSLSFAAIGSDNVGMLLDNVAVAAIPLPAAAWAGVSLMGLLVASKSLRRRTV